MPKQSIQIVKRVAVPDFDAIYNSENFLELKIGSRSNRKKNINILISGDILLRIEKKTRTKSESAFINESFVKGIVSIKNLVSAKSAGTLKEVVLLDRQIKDKVNESISRIHSGDKHGFAGFYRNIESRWERINELQKSLGLNLLRNDKVGFCNRCNAFRSGSGFPGYGAAAVICPKCNKEVTKKKSYKCLPDPIRTYIDGGWLEDYAAEKLRKLGWQVWPHIYIYGNSGVRLEIDILAIKKGFSLIVECKSGGTSAKDLSTFLAKFNDIKTNLALFISTQKVDGQIKSLVRKNFSFTLLDDIKNDRNLEKQLKNLLK
jgi:hypothetical protein